MGFHTRFAAAWSRLCYGFTERAPADGIGMPSYGNFSVRLITNGAAYWEFFTLGSNHYLAMANRRNDSTYNIDSKLYRAVFNVYLPLILK
jgi:hypothetical protein